MLDEPTEEKQATKPAAEILKKVRAALSDDNISQAIELIEQRDRDHGRDAESHSFQSLIQYKLGKIEAAIEMVEKALALDPQNSTYLENYANFISTQGRFAEAERILVKLISENPTNTSAFHNLAGIRKFKPGDDVLWLMEQKAVGQPLSTGKAANLCFGLAKAYDDLGDYDKAWQAVTQGNDLIKKESTTDYFAQGTKRCKEVYTKDFITQRSRAGHMTRAPIFVVGMPRSGTTLTEKILSEHMDITATGELRALGQIGGMMAKDLDVMQVAGHGNAIEKASEQQIYAAARGYLNYAAQQIPRWAERFVDKMPDNSFNLGLVACLFPKAHMIHVMRHPLDIMLSIYFKKFGQLRYAFSPVDIVAHYKSYRRVIGYWHEVLGARLIEIRYENVVEDKDRARDFLLERIIPTDEHRPIIASRKDDGGKVMTASRWQVRQPVYQSSREKFRNYEKQMSIFIEAMGGMEAIEAEVEDQEHRCALRGAAAA